MRRDSGAAPGPIGLYEAVQELAEGLSVPAILAKAADAACRLGPAVVSMLWIAPEGHQELLPIAAHGIGEDEISLLHVNVGEGLAGRAADGRLPQSVDLGQKPEELQADLARRHGLRQALAVPMRSPQGDLKGVLLVARTDASEFDREDRARISALAVFTGATLDIAQRRQRNQLAHSNLTRLHESARDLVSAREPRGVLQTIVDRAFGLTSLGTVILWLLDAEGAEFVPAATRGVEPFDPASLRVPADRGLPGAVRRSKAPIVVDLRSHDDVHLRDFIRALGLRSAVQVPVMRKGDVIGVLGIGAREGRQITPEDVDTLATLAAYAGVALETSMLVEEAERARHDWEMTFQSVPDLIFVVGPDDRVVRANRAAATRLGAGGAAVEGRLWHQLLGLEVPVPAPASELLAESRSFQLEIGLPALEGTYELSGHPVREGGAVILVCRDVTETKRLQEQLLQAEKLSAVGQLVSGVAHELNNPMSSVMGFAELAAAAGGVPEDTMQYLGIIRDESQRAVKIVKNLLTFARQHKPERLKTQLNEVVTRVCDLLAYEMRTSRIQLVRQLAADLPPVMVDPHQFQQVFFNLLSNAHYALAERGRGGTITITTRAEGDRVVAIVADDGPGIPADQLPRIFDPFFTTKPVGKGTGLGLSVVYGIVREHGGGIRAESPTGGGAVFQVDLPVGGTEESPHAPSTKHLRAPQKLRILAVDDEKSVLELVRRVLGAENSLDAVESGLDAVERLRLGVYDVIISDMKMPDLSGRDLYHFIVRERPTMATHVLFTTGDVLSEETREFLRDYDLPSLEKPFGSKDLLAAVLRIINRP